MVINTFRFVSHILGLWKAGVTAVEGSQSAANRKIPRGQGVLVTDPCCILDIQGLIRMAGGYTE